MVQVPEKVGNIGPGEHREHWRSMNKPGNGLGGLG